jgi:hypothetical protein
MSQSAGHATRMNVTTNPIAETAAMVEMVGSNCEDEDDAFDANARSRACVQGCLANRGA